MDTCIQKSFKQCGELYTSRPTRDDGYRSTYVPKLLPGEVFNQAADQGAFPHLGGPNDYNHNWRGFEWSPVYKGDVVLFGLYILSPTHKYIQRVVSYSFLFYSHFRTTQEFTIMIDV